MADQQLTLAYDSSQEIWRDIPGYEGVYQASTHGRIKRIGGRSRLIGRTLKLGIDKKGYYRVKLRNNSPHEKSRLVHQIIALTFIGPRPEGCVINHIDGNKLNNMPSNLEYCTQAKNCLHSSQTGLIARGDRHGTHTQPDTRCKGEKHGKSKLTDDDIREIRQLIMQRVKGVLIAERFGVSQTEISLIKHGTRWKHIV